MLNDELNEQTNPKPEEHEPLLPEEEQMEVTEEQTALS